MASINRKRKGWSFCLSWDSLDRGSNFGSMSAGLSPRTIAHTVKASPRAARADADQVLIAEQVLCYLGEHYARCNIGGYDIQEKAFRGGAASERQIAEIPPSLSIFVISKSPDKT